MRAVFSVKAYGIAGSIGLMAMCGAFAPVAAQSFNCNYARAADEVAICQSRLLSRLDERMSSRYYSVRNSLFGSERRRLLDINRSWLRERRNCGRDYSCLVSVYRSWIRDLGRF